MEQKINVMLYGGKSIFGGREVPLRAKITYCDAADECPLRKQGKCLIPHPTMNCKHGRIEVIKGYTSRAKKYGEFKRRFKEDPLYGALTDPRDDVMIMTIGEDVFLKLGRIGLDYDPESNGWKQSYAKANDRGMYVCDPWMGEKCLWVPRDAVDVDFFEKVCKYRPMAFLDNKVISEFQQKNVPMIVHVLKDVMPDIYAQLIERCPKLAEKKLDHRGRDARAKTLRDGAEICDNGGNRYTKFMDMLICENYGSFFAGPVGTRAHGDSVLVIRLHDDDYIEVKDNDWVCDTTEFK